MPSIINSDDGQTSGSAGLKFTSSDDGVLKIQNNGTDAVNVDSSNIVTFTAPSRVPGTSVPYLIATSINTGTPVYANWAERTAYYNVEAKGSGTFLGGRYTPDVRGLYQVNVTSQVGASSISTFGAAIYLNGSLYRYTYSRLNTAINTNANTDVSHMILLNGTTDFVSGGYYMGASSGVTSLSIWFSVCLLQRIE